MLTDQIEVLVAGRYVEQEYPALREQTARWRASRPLDGLEILDATPIFHNTLLKHLALLAAGARLTLGVSRRLPNDAALLGRLAATGIPFEREESADPGTYDLVLDCAGAFSGRQARIGYAELTRSGARAYARCPRPVFMADEGIIKQIETCLGTGESYLRAMRTLGYGEWKGKKLVVFGSGKVGTGIILQAFRAGARVHVVTDPGTADGRVRACAEEIADYRDRSAVARALEGAYAVVTATGVPHALEGRIPAEALVGSDTLLANMGVEDEYGPSIPDERVLERKAPLNFMLEEPTLLRYIDATMALHNEGALYMALRPRPAGPLLPPEETERKLLDITRREGLIGPELDLLTVRERTERPRK